MKIVLEIYVNRHYNVYNTLITIVENTVVENTAVESNTPPQAATGLVARGNKWPGRRVT